MSVASDKASDADAGSTASGWLKCGVLLLALITVGLPINSLAVYASLLTMTVVVFTGAISTRRRAWLIATFLVVGAVVGRLWLAPPRFDEGHNVFLPGGPTQALKRELPAEVYDHLADEFDKRYLPEQHCKPQEAGCWLGLGYPDRAFAFSADGIFRKSVLSRSVAELDFSNPVWLRVGFINESRYNWYSGDLVRTNRDRRFGMGLHRWHVMMPWFEMVRFPAAYVGSELCWRGELMWEESNGHFSLSLGDRCRTVEWRDVGRRIFGLGIAPETLAMRLAPPLSVWLLKVAQFTLLAGALIAIVLTLVSVRLRALVIPFVLIGLSILVIAINDVSFIGGTRPMDGGDDGLFYDGVGRILLQYLLAGDYSNFLMGAERVYYYGGPGLRYFRSIEHIIFGESFLGYLSLILVMPLLIYALFRRFLPERWALGLGLLFVAYPVGKSFGTTFADYVEIAEQGYADPAAYILFSAGLLPLIGPKPSVLTVPDAPALKSEDHAEPAFFGALLLAFGIIMKPTIAPAAAAFLGGAGLAALHYRQWRRLAGMCIGFLPVFSMALHNWVFGHVFVLLSANATHPLVLNMPPSAYADAFRELVALEFAGEHLRRALSKIPQWLSSAPTQSLRTAPLNAAGVAILLYVVAFGRRFDPWLRLIGGTALAQHSVALFYVPLARYHLLTWLLTAVVNLVFLWQVWVEWLGGRFSNLHLRLRGKPAEAPGSAEDCRGTGLAAQTAADQLYCHRRFPQSDGMCRL
jgi:hypothetical protein